MYEMTISGQLHRRTEEKITDMNMKNRAAQRYALPGFFMDADDQTLFIQFGHFIATPAVTFSHIMFAADVYHQIPEGNVRTGI